MPNGAYPNTAHERTTLGEMASPAFWGLAVAGGAGVTLGLGWGCWQQDGLNYFLHCYLLNYCYLLSISLGALFFVALQHATRAGWSVTVRRLAELLAANVPCLALLLLPVVAAVLLRHSGLYSWTDANAVAADELLQRKAVYLNPTFFAVRCVLYFVIWGLLARFFLQRSIEQDQTGRVELTSRMERLSPVALLLFALTVTFASFDWLMSLDPKWFSTIFGVYYFSGAAVGFFAAVILLAMMLQASGRLTSSITVEHYHDLGKLLFAFVVFWGYIAFSQYLLIWYANVPEETTWYLVRQTGLWKWVSLVLLFGHLLIPLLGLLSREVKRCRVLLAFWAAWLLLLHWIDMYYLVMPSYWQKTMLAAQHASDEAVGLGTAVGVNFCLLVGLGGLYLAGLVRTAGNRSLVPLRDPRLEEALAFENF